MDGNYDLNVTFENFFSKQEIWRLQDFFLADDHILGSRAPEMKFDYNSVLTLVYEFNRRDARHVLKDVLVYNAKKIAERYQAQFKKELEEDKFLTEEKTLAFVKNKKRLLPEVDIKLQKLDYEILPELKDILVEQYNLIVDFLDKNYLIPYLENDVKLHFTKNKTDVLLLFYLLRECHIISPSMTDADLGSFLDTYFTYHDKNTNKQKVINKSRIFLNGIKSGSKTIEKSTQRLKNIIQDKNFFEIE